ncbi:hypothetical protein [Sphingobacterium sp. SYP-B4668]|uniref:hypothetical protein n=1 Tax=Sphingobacterium sp. SYP-B4668 TaxID=2996035 RepID=UPI0022DDB877|nr:hypothetical protein [Sphingobacterium sp. SYP-B4668]
MPYDNKTLIDYKGNTAYYIMKDDSDIFYSNTIDTNTAKATRVIRFAGIQDVTAIAKLKPSKTSTKNYLEEGHSARHLELP